MVKGGWFRESYRHYLAAKGISTRRYMAQQPAMERLPGSQQMSKQVTLPQVISAPVRAKNVFEEVGIGMVGSGKSETPGAAARRAVREVRAEARQKVDPERSMRQQREAAGVPDVEGAKGKAERFIAGQTLEYGLDVAARQTTPVGRAIAEARQGNYVDAFLMYNQLKKDPVRQLDAEALRSSLEAWAVSASKQGVNVPDAVYDIIGSEAKTQINLIRQQKSIEASPFKQELREISKEAAIGIVGAAGAAPGRAFEFAKETEGVWPTKPIPGAPGTAHDFPGITEVAEEASVLPFFTENFFLRGAKSTTGEKIDRTIGDTRRVFEGAGFTAKPIEMPKTYSELVQERIDTLFQGKAQLADVDFAAFDRGSRAFERGDREALIDSIVDLKGQEAALRDRWALVQAAHNQVVSAQNNDAIYGKGSSNPMFGNMMSNGASRITDQTRKLNAVKAEVKKANDKVFARRRILEYRLKRLDQVVPAEVGAPEKVQVFEDPRGVLPSIATFTRSAEETLKGVENPVFNKLGVKES